MFIYIFKIFVIHFAQFYTNFDDITLELMGMDLFFVNFSGCRSIFYVTAVNYINFLERMLNKKNVWK